MIPLSSILSGSDFDQFKRGGTASNKKTRPLQHESAAGIFYAQGKTALPYSIQMGNIFYDFVRTGGGKEYEDATGLL